MIKNIYLDYNATTPILPEILVKMQELPNLPMNASSPHSHGQFARNTLERARNLILKSVVGSAWMDYNVIFTSSGSESNNLIIQNFRNDNILYSNTEHSSIVKSAENTGNSMQICVNENGLIDLDNLSGAIKKFNPQLISISHANNETGVIQDISSIADICRLYNVKFHTDACQSFGKILCNFETIKPDIITVSSHKIYGPVGACAVIYKKNVNINPAIFGGGQEFGVRAGTENIYAIYGFSLATLFARLDLPNRYLQVEYLRDQIDENAIKLGHLPLCSSVQRIPNTTMIAKKNGNSSSEIMRLDMLGFSASSGSACSSGLHEESRVLSYLGISGEYKSTTRYSLGIWTSQDDVEKLFSIL